MWRLASRYGLSTNTNICGTARDVFIIILSKKSKIYFENTTDTNQTMAEDKKFAIDKDFMEL